MHLLKDEGHGNLSLVDKHGGDIPRYAILSHTWGAEEVTFRDLMEGTCRKKAGYNKIELCRKQAASDRISYFWVDTCYTIQIHYRRQYLMRRVAYTAENGGSRQPALNT
jgi:hypothetical protein